MTSTGKIAFCFPGQGSLEAGMGRAIKDLTVTASPPMDSATI